MNYPQALDYLISQLPMYQRIGQAAYKADLSNTIALCKALGNPENKFRSIHVAGTNGKGSVSHFLAAMFQYSGYKVGLFTSPHYLDFRERIKVNGKMIGKKAVADFVNANTANFGAIKPSFFEMSAALAFEHFANEKVDIAIIETGMGGRLDSTNVISPELSIITNIGKDHVQFLGDTLAKIAGEKAGIIKTNTPVVIGESNPETDVVFIAKATETKSPIYFADKEYTIKHVERKGVGHPTLVMDAFSKDGSQLIYLRSGLLGDYQVKNITTVLQSVKILQELGFKISEHQIRLGLKSVVKKTGMLGRWQILGTSPLTIADAAHNAHGLKYIVEQLKNTPHEKLHMVFGTVNDKDIAEILDLLPKEATYYFCKSSVPRALDAEELQKLAKPKKLIGTAHGNVTSALLAAQKTAGKQDLIFIGGSIFVVADALLAIQKDQKV